MTPASARRDRPEVWVNCAISLDGRLALAGGARARLSGPEDLVRVHRMRAASDAILVGVGTVLLDDPSLRVDWKLIGRDPGPAPTRVILDSRGRLPETARVLAPGPPTIVAVTEDSPRTYPPSVETIVAGRQRVDLAMLFQALARRGFRRVMVEGGAEVLASTLGSGLFDRFTVYVAPVLIGGEGAPSLVAGAAVTRIDEAYSLTLLSVERLGRGFVATFGPGPARPKASP